MFRPPVALLALVGINGSLNADQKHDISTAAVQAAPGAVVTAGTRFMGLAPSDMLAVLSGTFILLQIGYLIWKWRRDARHEEEREADRRRGDDRRSGEERRQGIDRRSSNRNDDLTADAEEA